jgi:putative salt-induced outer membrane protein YdiY
MRGIFVALFVSTLFLFAASLRADEVLLKNGDKITGTVGQVDGGTLNFTSPVLGALKIKLSDIQSYKTDKPANVQLKNGSHFSSPITKGDAAQITTADKKTTPVETIKTVNPPPEVWTGAIVFNGAINRGNTNTETAGLSANAVLRRDDPFFNDRFTVAGDYNFGNTGRGSNTTTTTDNLDALFKYDRFFSPKLYGYGTVGYDHDRVAQLNVRVTPGVGVGYQWVETPKLNFNTEAGATYVYEDFDNGRVDQKEDFRLAYHLQDKLNDKVMAFNDVEFLAAFQNPADYLLTADAGIRADLLKNFFAQFKVVYKRNDRPAHGSLKDDLAFLLGVGWAF